MDDEEVEKNIWMDPDALSVDCGICFMPYEGEVYMVSIVACNTSSFSTATTNYLWIVASNNYLSSSNPIRLF